jgi:trk system potassium uptake protein TrkA
LGAKHTIARVRNPEYATQLYELKDDLGLSLFVNPEKAAAEEIARVLRFPSASHVEFFARGHVELVCCRLNGKNKLNGERICDLKQKFGFNVLICAIDRDGTLIIPSGNFVLAEDDELYLTGSPKEILKAFKSADLLKNPIKSVIVSGAGKITYYLCEALAKDNINIKVIEKDEEIAEKFASQMKNAVVLCGDASDHELLLEEGIAKTDAFVALTGLDEGNVLSALYAQQNNVSKVIAKINSDNISALTKDLGIETIISSKSVTSNQILSYVRAVAETKSNVNILSIYKILGGRCEVLEFNVEGEISKLTGIPLSKLKLKPNLLIANIVRGSEAIIPSGADSILPGDIILVVTSNGQITSLADILEG